MAHTIAIWFGDSHFFGSRCLCVHTHTIFPIFCRRTVNYFDSFLSISWIPSLLCIKRNSQHTQAEFIWTENWIEFSEPPETTMTMMNGQQNEWQHQRTKKIGYNNIYIFFTSFQVYSLLASKTLIRLLLSEYDKVNEFFSLLLHTEPFHVVRMLSCVFVS